jgi:hypothetical protein
MPTSRWMVRRRHLHKATVAIFGLPLSTFNNGAGVSPPVHYARVIYV